VRSKRSHNQLLVPFVFLVALVLSDRVLLLLSSQASMKLGIFIANVQVEGRAAQEHEVVYDHNKGTATCHIESDVGKASQLTLSPNLILLVRIL
jgi:hypothetical protein